MKYRVGDKVCIKSLDWYNKNINIMKTKKVKITLPKGCKATGVNTKVEDDAIVVEYSPEKKYIPRDGDIIFENSTYDPQGWIAFFKEEDDYNRVWDYRSYRIKDGFLSKYDEFVCKSDIIELRPANAKEKKMLFDKMKEQGLRWNAEKKEIEKLEFSPKDGEIIYVKTDNWGFISIFAKESKSNIFGYCDLCIADKDLFINVPNQPLCTKSSIKELRPATEAEKKMLFDVMEKQGLRWNATDKKIDDKSESDSKRYYSGNYFQTEEEAKECRDKVKDIFKNR